LLGRDEDALSLMSSIANMPTASLGMAPDKCGHGIRPLFDLQFAIETKKAAGWVTSGFMACFSLLLVRGIPRAAGCGLDAAIF
jgi:hypothetical protein